VIIVPIIVVLTLLVVQFVLVWHGRHVAQAAAQNAARSAAAYQAQPAAGQRPLSSVRLSLTMTYLFWASTYADFPSIGRGGYPFSGE
jgi:Flp pilus assembly protein TadG